MNIKKSNFFKKIKSNLYTILFFIVLICFWIYKGTNFVTNFEFKGTNSVSENNNKNPNNESSNENDVSVNIDDTNKKDDAKNENDLDKEDINKEDDANNVTGSDPAASADENSRENDSGNDATNNDGGLSGGEENAKDNQNPPKEYDPTIYPYNQGEVVGNYVIYEPQEISSKYYSDAGKIALSTEANFKVSEDEYFDDACFIGDSRMVGIYDYCGWDNAYFYCNNGYCLNSYVSGKTVTCQNDGNKYTLEEAMSSRSFGKIYIMLGINDCGYGDTELFKERYSQMLECIREKQPDAIIYLFANLHVSKKAEKNDKTGVYTNININDKNVAISELANPDNNIYYIEYNTMFYDEEGFLKDDVTFDGFHLYAQYYMEWATVFREHTIEVE